MRSFHNSVVIIIIIIFQIYLLYLKYEKTRLTNSNGIFTCYIQWFLPSSLPPACPAISLEPLSLGSNRHGADVQACLISRESDTTHHFWQEPQISTSRISQDKGRTPFFFPQENRKRKGMSFLSLL